MFKNVKWIAQNEAKLSPWKYEEYTEEKDKALRETAKVENGSAMFRKDFVLKSDIESAELKISGLGFYEVWLNNKKPDEMRVFAPVLSDYYNLTRYDVYDVTDLLISGKNVICAELGAGWFAPLPKWWGWQQFWYGNPRMAAQLSVTYKDGTTDVFETDETWCCHDGCITFSEMFDGEESDFRLVPSNWREEGFDYSAWKNAIIAEPPTDNIVESYAPPIRICEVLKPTNRWKISDTEMIYDFGVNGAAIPKVLVRGNDGDMVQFNFAENINEDGTLDAKSLLGAISCDKFTLTQGEEHLCEPRFIWHGYRYMMVTLSNPDIEVLSVESCVIHSDVKTTGTFSCSDKKLTRLHEVYVRTMLACLMGVPIDCPQRNERKAWLGDAQIVAQAMTYNFDMYDLYHSLLEDIRLSRLPYKAINYIAPIHLQFDTRTTIDYNVAYQSFMTVVDERYEDIELLRYHYQTLKEHLEYYENQCKDGFVDPCWFGDWFSVDMPEGMKKVDFRPGPEGHRQNPPFLGTMFYCQQLRLSADIADRLGEAEDAEYYRKLWQVSREALNKRCLDKETGRFGSGGQFLQAFALYENIVPEDCRDLVFKELLNALKGKEYHLWCGIVGHRIIFDVLRSFGREDIAWKVITTDGYPGPLNMLAGGRTTLTEGLDFRGSGCHNMFAGPDTVFYKIICGININRRNEIPVVIAPYFPENLEWAKATQKLKEGTISVFWERKDGKVNCEIVIPDGIKAEIKLPGREAEIVNRLNKKFVI